MSYTKTGKDHFNYKHGQYGTPLYKKWEAMKRRCLNKNEKCYPRYGGRGIKICKKWLEFIGFAEDMGTSFVQGMSLERVNNDGDYCKINCKWIPISEQARNKRSVTLYEFGGELLSIPELSKKYGIKQDTLYARLKNYGWSLKEALTTKVSYGNKYRNYRNS